MLTTKCSSTDRGQTVSEGPTHTALSSQHFEYRDALSTLLAATITSHFVTFLTVIIQIHVTECVAYANKEINKYIKNVCICHLDSRNFCCVEHGNCSGESEMVDSYQRHWMQSASSEPGPPGLPALQRTLPCALS